MKNLLLTATVLVVFSFASLASVKNLKTDLKKNSKSEKILRTAIPCDIVWNVSYYYSLDAGFSAAQASTIAFAAHDKCLGCE